MNTLKKCTMDEVNQRTREFLNLHWNGDARALAGVGLPEKWEKYDFGAKIPYGDRQGCHALVKEDGEVVYIGLGASRGYGIYNEHGIGNRLMKHVLVWDRSVSGSIQDRKFGVRDSEKTEGVTKVYTFGFPNGYGYMAPSLEAFLIRELNPGRNVVKTG